MTTPSQPSVRSQDFLIELQSDVVISQSNATAGQHQSLDYLPGANFLGLVAQRGYTKFSPETAWNVFHSGKVRFGDGLPLTPAGESAWPMSLSFHRYKGETATNLSGTLNPWALFDPANPEGNVDSGRQPEQLRKHYISADGTLQRMTMGSRMKTAIDVGTARAAESQLFGYQSIASGQRFVFRLEADDTLDPATLDQVTQLLTGPARLGRSRSAQYGRVEITPFDTEWQWPETTETHDTLTLWLMSDLALLDQHGQPTFRPEPWMFKLPEGTRFNVGRSYLRTRAYSVFNGKRRTYDDERQVITRGSVLRFDLARPLTANEHTRLNWAGLHNESGLGRLAVNPAMLAGFHPRFSSATSSQAETTVSAPKNPKTKLIDLLERRAGIATDHATTTHIATEMNSHLVSSLQTARRYAALLPGEALENAPGRNQFGQIRELASRHRRAPEALYRLLFESNDAVIRARSGWELALSPTLKLCKDIKHWKVPAPEEAGKESGKADDITLEQLKTHPLLPDIIGQWATLALEGDVENVIAGHANQRESAAHG